jgi:atlastin
MNMSSDTDESAVIVEHNDVDDAPELTDEGDSKQDAVPKNDKDDDDDDDAQKDDISLEQPHPYQIVSIGSEENAYAFHFENQALDKILGRIPSDYKVAVVSVVGAFRTGKSFLLSWFLRYLKYLETKHDDDDDDKTDSAEPWYKTIESVGNEGFDWKAGSERSTTGIRLLRSTN